ncbi:hypothetical protein [Pseudomonas ogarae]|uniref:hypothetical protein n=1 Tax=Pseudomonas ogarae (strain DSM 112162 / CECT 30235 / F113) TaxID=1114970 RepID=UPI0005FB1DE6|nr:hypothetical protein [Pseudomonas ogarae]
MPGRLRITQVRSRCSGEAVFQDDEYEVIDVEHQLQLDQGQHDPPGRGVTIQFAFLLENANSNLKYFKLSLSRVIEPGIQVET